MGKPELPTPPDKSGLTNLRRRARTRRYRLERLLIDLVTTTPILGGGVVGGQPDDVMPIRVPSIRGHLRFWWRALQAPGINPNEMRSLEQILFGGAAGHEGSASRVIVSVTNVKTAGLDYSEPSQDTADGYALYPARSEKSRGTPAKPRWKAGLKFTLTVDVPIGDMDAVCKAVRAWILFGGYGGRTRRGCGSLACVNDKDRDQWLPSKPTAAAMLALFGINIFANDSNAPANDTARLAGATLLAGDHANSSHHAWIAAIGLLKDFRQDQGVARDEGREGRPGRSRWPEADKARQLVNRKTAHDPRHNATPAWPRAAFGLPINFRFQQYVRPGQKYPESEPESFELSWRDASGNHERLASPLILKPLALSNGSFAPIVLWLDRAFPNGEVVAKIKDRRIVEGSVTAAPFDRIIADGDDVRFEPLKGHSSIRSAFLDWVIRDHCPSKWLLVAGALH